MKSIQTESLPFRGEQAHCDRYEEGVYVDLEDTFRFMPRRWRDRADEYGLPSDSWHDMSQSMKYGSTLATRLA